MVVPPSDLEKPMATPHPLLAIQLQKGKVMRKRTMQQLIDEELAAVEPETIPPIYGDWEEAWDRSYNNFLTRQYGGIEEDPLDDEGDGYDGGVPYWDEPPTHPQEFVMDWLDYERDAREWDIAFLERQMATVPVPATSDLLQGGHSHQPQAGTAPSSPRRAAAPAGSALVRGGGDPMTMMVDAEQNDPMYLFVVDTESYSGNFEREMIAWVTGQIGECGVGEENIDPNMPADLLEWCKDCVLSQPSDRGCNRPAAIWPTPGWYNDGWGGHLPVTNESPPRRFTAYQSVVCPMDALPPKAIFDALTERAKLFCDDHGLGFTRTRLLKLTIVREEVNPA